MRYSFTALVLATVTIGQVAASPAHHVHQHFHEKKEVDFVDNEALKRDPSLADVDWSKVHYTYSAGQTWGSKTAAPVAPPVAVATAAAAPVVAAAAPAAPPAAGSSATTSVTGAISGALSSVHLTKLTSMGVVSAGLNALTSNGQAWLGTDGPYVNEFVNSAAEDIILVVWGSWASWVNVKVPLITVSLPKGATTYVSFASGVSGAYTGVYSDTKMVNGQVSNTWGEFTFSPDGVVDVSREVNMAGHDMSIETPLCKSTMDVCTFLCLEGVTCTTGYVLHNCANGSQAGATYGQYDGADSGGCRVGPGSKVAIKTTFS